MNSLSGGTPREGEREEKQFIAKNDLERHAHTRSGDAGDDLRGRKVYLQSRLLERTVIDAAAHTALYLAVGLFPLLLNKP